MQGLQARETQALVDEKQLENNSENIKFITMPSTARKGRNMRKIMLALAILGSAFSVFMLALLRVFLDPKLYGPGPHSRIAQTIAPVAAQEYYGDIPEAVPNYAPEAEPVPAYAPAAYGDAYDQSGGAGAYEQTEYGTSPYGEPGPVEYVHPQSDQMYADGSYADNSYAGMSTTSANPYTSTTAQPYPAPSAPQPEVQYTGPDGNIPVLG